MKICNLGLTSYPEVLDFQFQARDQLIDLLEQKKSKEEVFSHETLISCSHHPIVTLGRKSAPGDLCGWDGEVVEVSRGGKATYHGPGQLIIYPIISLSHRANDVGRYLRSLEKVVVEALEIFGLKAYGDKDSTGVWIEGRKIASIGIAIKKWVTYHGIAINLRRDPLAFKGINPCGFSTEMMTSLENELNREISDTDWNQFSREIEKRFFSFLMI